MKQNRRPRNLKYKLIASSLLLFTQTFAACAKQTDPASEPMEQTESTAELQKESTEISEEVIELSEGAIELSEGSAESSEENKTTPDALGGTRTSDDNHEKMIVTKECAIEEGEDGEICIRLTTKDFEELGFTYGDSVDLVFSNGCELRSIPFYSGNSSMKKEVILSGMPEDSCIRAKVTYGEKLWVSLGVTNQDTVNITLREKGRFSGIILDRQIKYSNDRKDYASDEVFANFWNVKVGDLKEGILYRSASPCDNLYLRASYVDHLLSEAGISFILDLSDDGERIEEHFSETDFKSDYFKRLYDEGQVKGLKLTTDYSSASFKETLAEGLVSMEEAEGPYLIQCLEGKERTGFVCALLECLCGADYDEVEKDFMKSFENYYGITENSQKENYDMLVRSFLEPMLWAMMGEEADVETEDAETVDLKKVDLKKVDLKKAALKEVDLKIYAERYLADAGMTSEQIQKLRSKLTG